MNIDGGLRKIFRDHIPTFMWTSIETGGTGLGVADSHYLARPKAPGAKTSGTDGFIEYKQTSGWAVTLRTEQSAWLSQRVRYGGRAWIGVRRLTKGGPRSPAADELWLIPGRLSAEARAGGLQCPEVRAASCSWSGGPARWDWDAVARLLVS
jgi:hypothetical protein